MKKYIIIVSEKFPAYHKKTGQPTNFIESIKSYDKIHTIRGSYNLWKKRFEQIDAGKAYLSIRIWTGKPYASKQIEIFKYDKTHKISIQKFEIFNSILYGPSIFIDDVKHPYSLLANIAKNDGLRFLDFVAWFKGKLETTPNNPLAIIHFTPFKY